MMSKIAQREIYPMLPQLRLRNLKPVPIQIFPCFSIRLDALSKFLSPLFRTIRSAVVIARAVTVNIDLGFKYVQIATTLSCHH